MRAETSLFEYVMARLRDKSVTQMQVANGSGVPYHTLVKIAQGRIKDPSVHTVQKLANYFRDREAKAQPEKEAA